MQNPLKIILRTVAAAALGMFVTAGWIVGPYYLRVQSFEADPALGFHADYFLYVSPGAKRAAGHGKPMTILVQPNNSGTNSDDPDTHRNDAWWTGFGRHGLADDLDVVLLVPAFVRPAVDWKIYTHALDRDVMTTDRPDLARLDLQLIAMVDHARAELAKDEIATSETFLIQGFSASGMFANRFATLHPERVMAVAAGSPGGWPIAPVAEWDGEALPYPAGIADLEELVGEPFHAAAYRSMPQLIVMGSADGNDSVDFRDGWDEEPAALLDRLFGDTPKLRWPHAQAIYMSAGANVRFLLVDGVGHDRKSLQRYTTEFFGEVLSPDHE